MRKLICLLALVLAAHIAWGLWTNGRGQVVNVTTTPVRIGESAAVRFTANTVSVYNSGTNVVWGLVNCTTNTMVTRVAAGTAIPIPSYATYTWDAREHDHITSVCLATSNGTSVAYVATF